MLLRHLQLVAVLLPVAACATAWDCELLPPEHKVEVDDHSGATIIFATTHPASDTNFYFHDRCFLWDNRLMLFNSDRFGRTEIMGYLLDTGELVRLNKAEDAAAGGAVVSRKGDRIYVGRQGGIYEWKLSVSMQPKTAVSIAERKLTDIPEGAHLTSSADENCDGSLLAYSYEIDGADHIAFYDFSTGEVEPAAQLAFEMNHLQFHWNRPDLLSVSRGYGSDVAPVDPDVPRHARIWFMNLDTRVPTPAFYQVPGEIATHECWWVNDQITFIGGHHHVGDREEGHVKVLNLKTGEIRIIGAGAWMDEATAVELARVNWWHAAGSPDGKWVAADNWHGIIALFNAKTTERKTLATGHRTYGGGQHPHVGWDLTGKQVEFTSNKRGNPDVCIAEIPRDW